ncbi:MAG: helix-turn-helix transcriptional regulator [Clostridia bacterium]|nr:helix-turn-helix transcriptional regulator [Clostridia bacterium]
MQILNYNHSTITNAEKTRFSLHSHNHYEIILFLKGNATHVVEDRKYKLSNNDLIIIRPPTYHFIQIDHKCDYERVDIIFSERASKKHIIDQVVNQMEVVNISSNPIALDIFSKLTFYKQQLSEKAFSEVAVLLVRELFYNLSLFKDNVKTPTALSPTLSQALNYINENLTTVKSIQEIASSVFVTPSYLFRMFKDELKTSPKQYILEKRLLLAQNLILMGKPATSVCEQSGFNDYSTFYKNFVRYFGHKPSLEKTD